MDGLLSVPAPLAYALIGLLVFAEAAVLVGFVLPGETAVVLGGVLAAGHRLSLTAVLVLVVTAAIVGDTVGFEVGRRFGPRLLTSRPLVRHADRLAGAQRMLRERGGWAVFAGRFVAFLRAVMPGLAGASNMPYRRFLAFNALGGLVWGTSMVMLGFLAGNSYARVESALGRGTAVVVAVAALVGLGLFLRARHSKAAAAAAGAAARDGAVEGAAERQA